MSSAESQPEVERPRIFPFPLREVWEIDGGVLGSDGLLAQRNDHTPCGGIIHIHRCLDLVANGPHKLVKLDVVLAAMAWASRGFAQRLPKEMFILLVKLQ